MGKKLQYKKVGRLQNNVRYTIDYDKDGKAKVKYSYIIKHNYRRLNPFLVVFIALSIILIIAGLGSKIYYHYYPFVDIKTCESARFFVYNNLSYINLSCIDDNNKTINSLLYYSTGDVYSGWSESAYTNLNSTLFEKLKESRFFTPIFYIKIGMIILSGILFVFLCYCLYKIKIKQPKDKIMKKMASLEDELNAKLTGGQSYEYCFKKVPDNNIIEIPFFNNNCLKYKAKGDFAKYLYRIEVREHPFYMKLKTKKWHIQDFLFFCKFYFSQNPKHGKLLVRWK